MNVPANAPADAAGAGGVTSRPEPAPDAASPFSLMQLVLLAVLSGIGPLGTDIYLASVPNVAEDLGSNATVVQFTLTGFMVGLACGSLIIGPISDRYGRYKLLLAGVIALLLSSALCAFAPTIELLIAARIVQGLSGSIVMTLNRALVSDVVSGAAAARVYSLLSTVMGISPIVAPVIGGVIQQWGHWRLTFWALVAICVLLTVGVLWLLSETLPPERRHAGGFGQTLRNTGRVFRDRHFVSYAVALACTSGALFAYISASPFVVQRVLGFSPLTFALIFAINAAGLTLAAGVSAGLVARVGPVPCTRIGAAVISGGAMLLLCAAVTDVREAWLLLLAMFLIPTGAGFMFGNATALAAQTVGYAAGTAMALIGCGQFGMSALVAPLVSLAGPLSITPLAVITVVAAFGVAIAVTLGAHHHKRVSAV